MNYQVPYQIENKIQSPQPGNCVLDAEIGKRFDRFAYERISSDFAVKEILREAEDCILDQYDDEYCIGMWRGEFWGKQILSAVGVCRAKQDEELKEVIRKSVYRMLAHQKDDGYLGSEETSYNYVMCDYASAANRDLEDVRYFTVFV